MQDSIYTIPISEVFEPKCGCPICALRDTLEERCIEYIMGAAMMEPDVRIETNKQGFCKPHFDMMAKCKNRLSLALMLESHLKEIQSAGLKVNAPASAGIFKKKEQSKPADTCFVCSKIDWAIERMHGTVIKMYEQNSDFRALYSSQSFLCFPHFKALTSYAAANMDKKSLKEFLAVSTSLCKNYLDTVSTDVSHYCKMFDYRNSGPNADWQNSKDSIERSIYFLTSRQL